MIKPLEMKKRRVVITGLGVVSSLGIGWEEFWKNLLKGKSGISRLKSFDTSKYERHFAGEVRGFKPEKFLNKDEIRMYGRATQMGLAAARMSVKDAKLNPSRLNKSRIMVCVGTTTGEIQLLENFNDTLIQNTAIAQQRIPVFPSNILSSSIAKSLGVHNRNFVFSTACAAGNYATAEGYDAIRYGEADYALVGGADAISRIVYTGFGRLFAIAPKKCQPFDKNRKGMIPGEGAAMIVLESLDSARKRGASIYAEVLGTGFSCDATHMTNPSPNGIVKALEKSLKNSGVDPKEVDYINAHGTGTIENDSAEAQAIERVFYTNGRKVPVSSIKSMLGHTMGAASALETIVCCLAIKEGKIPPTINHKKDDPECGIDCVPNKKRNQKVKITLNNSQAFGGNNCCVILRNKK